MLATRVLASNPGPMTLEGTNTYVVRRPDSIRTVVIDPGPRDPRHLDAILSQGKVELILLTHHHLDHSDAANRLAERAGAPVRSAQRALCVDGEPLIDGEEMMLGGTRIRVIATPGHTSDSVSFHLVDDRSLDDGTRAGSVLTGDTILGRGTTVIAGPDGSFGSYVASLERLRELGAGVVLPGHGPMLGNLAVVASAYLDHRRTRLQAVTTAVESLRQSSPSQKVTAEAVADIVYAGLAPHLRRAAEATVAAQLDYLAEQSAVAPADRAV